MLSSSQLPLRPHPRSLGDHILMASAAPSTLPPTVEAAYRKKCLEIRRRLLEVEENNDTYRLRRARLLRNIRKMRIERGLLLEILGKRMRKNGSTGPYGQTYDEETEDSTESPPTPQERPLRVKKSHRRLPDLSSPSILPALPTTSTQLSHSNLPTPLTGTGLPPNGIIPTQRPEIPVQYSLLPPPGLLDGLLADTNPPLSAHDSFKQHILVNLMPQRAEEFGNMSAQQKAHHADGMWQDLQDHERSEWNQVYDIAEEHHQKTREARQWRQVAGERHPRRSAIPAHGLDDDLVMLGDEEEENGRR